MRPMRILSGVLIVVATAAVAHAQDAPRSRPWSFSLSAGASYEGNALFTAAEEDNTEFAQHVTASLGRTWTLRRGSVGLAARADKPFYDESTGLNDLRYSFNGTLTYAFTPRLTWGASSEFSSSLAQESDVLIDAGLVLPSVTTRSTTSTSSLSYLLTRRSLLSWSFGGTGVDFASALFVAGSSLTSTVTWSHQVGARQSLGVSQEYQRTFAELTRANIVGFFGTWSLAGRGGWTAAASAGVRPYTVPLESGYRLAGAFNASIAKTVRLGQVLSVQYADTIEQTYGLDATNHLVHTLSGSYLMGLGRSVSATFGGSFSRGRNPVTDAILLGGAGQASIGYRILDNLSLTVGSAVFSRTEQDRPRVVSYSTYVSLMYSGGW